MIQRSERSVISGRRDTPTRVYRLCDEILHQSEDIAHKITLTIRRDLPSYEAVPADEHLQTVTDYVRETVGAWRQKAEPTPSLLEATRAVVRRRVYWGVPLHDFLVANNITARVLWDSFRSVAAENADEGALVDIVGLITRWSEARSALIANAFMEELGSHHRGLVSVRQRFLEALRGRSGMADQAQTLASELGFDPNGAFQAICGVDCDWPQDQIDKLLRELESQPGVTHCGVRGNTMIALSQDCDQEVVIRAIADVAPAEVRLGVGLRRDLLCGAEESIGDGESALKLTAHPGGGTLRFEDVWHAAVLADAGSRLDCFLADGQTIALNHPELGAAVMAYFESGLALSETADRLFLHRNGVLYRLNRWRDLTGWDPRTMEGLLRSVAAVTTALRK